MKTLINRLTYMNYSQYGRSSAFGIEEEGFFIDQIESGEGISLSRINLITDDYSLLISVDAKFNLMLGAEHYYLVPGTALLIKPQTHLCLLNTTVRKAFIIRFNASFFSSYSYMSLNYFGLFNKSSAILIHMSPVQLEEIEVCCEQCLANFWLPASLYKNDILGNLLISLLLNLLSCINLKYSPLENFTSDKNMELVNSFLTMMDQNFRDIAEESCSTLMSHKQYAEKLNVHPTYLYRFISINTGITVKGWIRKKLIEDIKYLVTDSNKSIRTISSMYGFYEMSNFYSFFKKHAGMSLSAFIKSRNRLTLEID